MRRLFVLAFGLFAVSRSASAEVISKPDGTRFDVSTGATATPGENNVITLRAGAVRARMPEDGRKAVRPRIVTDAATVMVLEGDALVAVDEEKATRVSVHRGGASITVRGKSIEIPDGFGVKIMKGGAPGKPTPLAVAPVWSAPERRTFVVAEAAADVMLPFEPLTVTSGTPAASWHLQLAKDPAFTQVVVDTTAPAVTRRLEAKMLAPGTYYARASAVDADGFEGKWSTTSHATVVRADVAKAPFGRVRVSVEPETVKCKLDGTPATFPVEADQHHTHDLVCGEGPGSKLVVGARPLEGVRITTTTTPTSAQSGSLKVIIVDIEGQPVDRLSPVVMTTSDLAVAPLVATGAPGEYVARYTFVGPPHAVPISIRLRDDWVAKVGAVNFAPWLGLPGEPAPGDAKEAPKPDDRRRKGTLEIGAAGLASWRGKPPVGVGFEADLRGAIAMPHGALFIGVAGGWSKLLESTREGLQVEGTAVSVRALIGYRFGTGVVAPYVQLGPEVVRQWVQVPAIDREGREWLVGASGGLGLEVEAGPGAFFIEARGRAVAPAIEDEPSLTASGGLGLLGYRLRL